MKKKTLFTSLALLLALGVLASCNPSPSSSSPAPSSPSDTSSSQPSSSELPEWVDYAKDGTVKLALEYQGKDFYKDGIGQVTLKTPIDGDTAHFNPLVTTTSSYTLKARFYGIDTPESTGSVQPYGRGASDFTKEHLQLANTKGTIVVSSPQDVYGVPSPDSTGSRYVSLVWINTEKKNAPIDELYLLNLMIVQEGWSWVKNLSEYPKFSETFYAAQEQAELYKLNLFSGLPDPRYNYGEYEEASLLDIKREVEKQIADPNYRNAFDGEKVRIMGTVTGYANNVLYVQNFYTKEQGARYDEGEYAGINIYTSASGLNNQNFTTPGAYVQICGTCSDSETFGFQISGCSFPRIPYDDDDCKVLIKAADNDEYPLKTFTYTPLELSNYIKNESAKRTDALNGDVVISEQVRVSSCYIDDSSSDKNATLYFETLDGTRLEFSAYVAFNYKPDPENKPNFFFTTEEQWVDQVFEIKGVYTYRRTSTGRVTFQINPRGNSDLIILAE